MADEIQALLKRLDTAGEFPGPAKEANEKRFAKLCRDALQMGDFPEDIRAELEKVTASLQSDTKKGMIFRLPENRWKEFKHQLLSDNTSAQQWFEKQVEAYLRAGKPGGR